MRLLSGSSPVGIILAGAGPCLLLIGACTTIHTVQPADLSPPHPPARIWVTRADQATVVFDSALVSGDSLTGLVNGLPQGLLLSEATVLRIREPSPDRTAALVFFSAGGAAAVLTVYLLDKSTPASCSGPFPPCCPVSERPCA